jgi:hypothetical protein
MAIRKSANTDMNKQNNLLVPYFSQNDETVPVEWHDRACGVTCLAMALAYYDLEKTKISDLINEGLLIGGYVEGLGWQHECLVRIFRNKGIHSYAEEFRAVDVDLANKKFSAGTFEPQLIQGGIEKITYELDKRRPVIVSMHPHFRENKVGHLVILVGYEGNPTDPSGFHFHDPDSRFSAGNDLYVDRQHFNMYWRKFAVFSRQLHQL